MYLGLAARKNSCSLHILTLLGEEEERLKARFAQAGKKLDMGKACIHFRKPDDLPLDVIADIVSRTPVDDFITWFEASRARR